MGAKKYVHQIVSISSCLISTTWMFVFSIYWISFANNFNESVSFVSTDFVTQVTKDWNTKPFVDIEITTESKCSSDYPDEVFYQLW